MEAFLVFGAIVLIMAYLLDKLFSRAVPNIRCPNCNYIGQGKRYVKGNFLIEIILWLCFLVPGIIYSIWRVSSRYCGCPKCNYQYVVKLNKEEYSQEQKKQLGDALQKTTE